METCIEDDEIGERMDAGRKALLARGDNEVGPYQSPMEDGMQHFHESGSPARGSLATPHWRWQISRGVVGFSALFAYFYAITLLPLATAVTLNYTSAIFLAIYLALAGMRMRVRHAWGPGGRAGRRRPAAQANLACRSADRRPDSAWAPACWPAWPISAYANWGARRAGNPHGVLFFAGLIGLCRPLAGLQRIACGRPEKWPAFARCRQLSRPSPN
jgi:hypothetical protein